MADTDAIIKVLIKAYEKHLIHYTEDERTTKQTSDNFEQGKIMEKEINAQKNKVFREVLTLIKDIKQAKNGKETLIKDIQNQNNKLIKENDKMKKEFGMILKLVPI